MSSVDNRVVKMTFDNDKFEKNAATTLSTLDKLKKSLDFSGAVRGLDSLSSSAKSISMEALAVGVETVSNNFSSLEVIGVRVLQRLTDMAFDAGRNIVSSLTVDPIKSGLQEYETQINSVQTILSNTKDALSSNEGLTDEAQQVERINSVLDDLNHYADMTIYNFTEMTRNIGTFTAAGVELDKSQAAIKGIANLAAMSGANSEQASRAMYQLSQALAAGQVKLMDWNSVVNASMGGQLFQNELLDTARMKGIAAEVTQVVDKLDEYGNVVLDDTGQAVTKKVKETITDIDELIEHEGSFRESLSSGWLSSDILLETLEKFTAGAGKVTQEELDRQKELWKARGYSDKQIQDLSANMEVLTQEEYDNMRAMWAARGYTDDQIDHILELGRSATDAATKVKTFTQLLETVGEALQSGWTQSWEYIVGDFAEAKALWTEISDLMNLYIGQSADARNNELRLWSVGEVDEQGNRLTEGLTGREMVIQGLRNGFQGIYEMVVLLNSAWEQSFLHKGKKGDLSITGKALIEFSKQFMDFTQGFKDSLVKDGKTTDFALELLDLFNSLFASLRRVYKGLFNLVQILTGRFLKKSVESFVKNFEIFSSDGILIHYIEEITKRFKSFTKILKDKVFTDNSTSKFFDGLFRAIRPLFELKMDVLLSEWDTLTDVLGYATDDWTGVEDLISNIGDALGDFGDNLSNLINDEDGASRFNEVFEELGEDIKDFIDSVNDSEALNPNFFDDWTKDLYDLMNKEPNKFFDILSDALEGVANICETLYAVFEPLVEAFFEVFKPSLFVDVIADITNMFKQFTEAIELNGDNMSGLKRFYKGVFDVLKAIGKIIKDLVKSAFGSLGDMFKDIFPDSKTVTDKMGELGDALSGFAKKLKDAFKSSKDSTVFDNLFKTIGDGIKSFVDSVKDLADIPSKVQGFIDWLNGIDLSNVKQGFDDFSKGISDTKDSGEDASESASLWEAVGKAIKNVIEIVKNIFKEVDVVGLIATISGLLMSKSFSDLVNFITDFPKKIEKLMKQQDAFNKVAGALKDTLKDFQDTLNVSKITLIAASIYLIASSVAKLAEVDEDKILSALGALSGGIAILLGTVQLLVSKVDIKKFEKNTWVMIATMIAIGIAGEKLADSVIKLGSMNPEQLAAGLLALAGTMVMMVTVLEHMDKKSPDFIKGAESLILMGVAMNVMALAIRQLGSMKPEELAAGLAAFAVTFILIMKLLEEMETRYVSFIKTAKSLIKLGVAMNIMALAIRQLGTMKPEELAAGMAGFSVMMMLIMKLIEEMETRYVSFIKTAQSLIKFGAAMNVMAFAIRQLGTMKPEELAAGIAGFAVTFAILMKTVKEMPTNLFLMDVSKGLIVLAVAMNVMALAIKQLASIDPANLAAGIAAFATTLAMMVKVVQELPANVFLMESAKTFIVLGVAMNIMAIALKQFASLSIDQMMIGLAGLAVSLNLLVVFIKNLPKDIVNDAMAFVILAAGVVILGKALTIFGSLGLDQMVIALIGLAGSLTMVAFAVRLFSDPNMIQAGLAMVIIGGACLLLGAGMYLLGQIGLGGLVIALVALAGGLFIFGAAAQFITPQIPAILALSAAIALLGLGLAAIVVALGKFCNIIVTLGAQGAAAIGALLDVFISVMPKIGDLVVSFINMILQVIIDSAPKFVEALLAITEQFFVFVDGFLAQLAEYLPGIISSILAILIDVIFINIALYSGSLAMAAALLLANFLLGLAEGIGDVVLAGFKLIIEFINGLAEAIRLNNDALWDAIGNLISAIVEAIVNGVKKLAEAAGKLIDGFLKEFDAAQFLEDLGQIGINIVMGIINGIGKTAQMLVDKAKELAANTLGALTGGFAEHSPSKKGYKIGYFLGVGTANGISKSASVVEDSAGAIVNTALDTLESINNIGDIDIDPVITPVFDMSNIQNGIDFVNGAFDSLSPDAMVGLNIAENYKQNLLSDMVKQNAKSMSKMMDEYAANSMQNRPKLEINVYGTSSPDDVANAVGQKVRLLGLV